MASVSLTALEEDMKRPFRSLAAAFLLVLLALPVSAEEVVRYETLTAQPANPLLIDVWTFVCPAGGSATIAVDTAMLASGAASPLDPVFEVYSPTGDFVGFGDDEITCSVASVCAFDCAQVTMDCAEGGEQTLLVMTAISNGCGETEGPYELSVQVFDGMGGSGTPLTADAVRLGGEAISRGFGWGFYPSGPALDDQPHGFFPPLGGVEAVERMLRLRTKVKRDR